MTRNPRRPSGLPQDFHEFKTPHGFANCWVSRDGRVVGPQYSVLKQAISKHGYPQVTVETASGKRTTKTVHRLVALAFVDNPNNYQQVNHIDGNKLNPKSDNLEWTTPGGNSAHAWSSGLCSVEKLNPARGESHYNHKVDSGLVRKMSLAGMNNSHIARVLGISRPHVSNIVNMKARRTG